MVFPTLEDAQSFYNEYSKTIGFKAIKRSTKVNRESNTKYVILACSMSGCPDRRPDTGKATKSTKINCPAKMWLKQRLDGSWEITKKGVILDHVHELTPNMTMMFSNNKNISMEAQRTIHVNDAAGVRACKTFRTFVHDVGGHDKVSFIERDLRNFLGREKRLLCTGGDGQALLGYFSRMHKQNNNFFYDIDFDDDFHIINLFWADVRTRAAYECFGDMVSFDTTYLTNGQTVLLGCGLLSSEDTDSFVWLFRFFLRCMSDKAPIGIVTDQCKSMQNAITLVFPTTHHQWCLWHVMKKIPEKLCRYDRYKEIKHDLKVVVYDSLSIDEFESNWAALLEKYVLHDNAWLSALFEQRARWVPIYLKPFFWAGMSTTQRSESLNAFFDGYINSKTSLAQFVLISGLDICWMDGLSIYIYIAF